MNDVLQLFVGLPSALQPFLDLHADARLYYLTADADLAVMPFDEPIQDALHRRFGTGDWPPAQGAMLSTTDQAFAAECSQRAPLAYIEISAIGGTKLQSAAVWQLGQLTIGPVTLEFTGSNARRSPMLWPVNVALRALGVPPGMNLDETTVFGLPEYHCNADIHALAWQA